MLGVLIVDDDAYIREGLKVSVAWEEYGFEVVGEAANGLAALEMLEIKKPVLILTDIKMPKMSGLELLSEINKRNLPVKVVMISAFNDFEFVREAMRLGARNYIVKPLNKDEIENAVKSLAEELENELKDQRTKRHSFTALKNNVLNRMLKDEISQRELSEKLEMLELDLHHAQMQVVIFKANQELEKLGLIVEDLEHFMSINMATQIPNLVFHGAGEHIYIIFFGKEEQLVKEQIKSITAVLVSKIKSRYHFESYVSVGGKVATYKKVASSYQEALRGLDYKIIYGPCKIIFYEDVQMIRNKEINHLHIPTNEIKEMVLSQNSIEVKKYVDTLFLSTLRAAHISPDQIVFATVEILSAIYPILGTMHMENSNQNSRSLVKIIMEMESLQQLEDWLLEQIDYVISKITEYREKKFSDVINEVITYIYNNYSEANLSLKTLSFQLDISATHLGRTFKNETGEYFSDYLNKTRINYAKELLLSTELSGKDIAQRVGFDNVNYFYTIFKKQTGVSTGEYKRTKIFEGSL